MSFPLGSLGDAPSQGKAASAAAGGSGQVRAAAAPVAVVLWCLGALVWLLWLLALLSHHPGDPAFTTSGDGQPLRNWVGLLGARASDALYVVLGFSGWWLLLFALRHGVGAAARHFTTRATPVPGPLAAAARVPETDARPVAPWLSRQSFSTAGWVWLGLMLMLASSCALEWTRLYRWEGMVPGGHAGGVVGWTLGPLSVRWLGFAGSGVFWIAAWLAGVALAFTFSWLRLAEYIGSWMDTWRERRVGRLERAEDQRLGAQATRERGHPVAEAGRTDPLIDAVPESSTVLDSASNSGRLAAAPALAASTLMPQASTLTITPGLAEVPKSARVAKERQQPLFNELADTKLPQVDLLDAVQLREAPMATESLEMTSRLIEKKLADFGVQVHVVAASPGPVITRYEIEPATGVKGSQIVNLARDLARSLSLVSIRVVEVIPGKATMALELPNARRQMIKLSEILGSEVYNHSGSLLTMGLGKDIVGHPMVADLAKMPHCLVAGTTGSGKSVGINAMILSLLYKAEARDVRLILIDPKMLEMSVYEGIPHLLAPVVTDMKQAANALNWCVGEMERRYRVMSKLGVRNLAGYNKKLVDATERGEPIANPFSLTPEQPEPLERLPQIVVVIDELADLMMVIGKKIEELIARLAQKARAAGIHLILATQRPSVDVITGLIKANIPTRLSFQVSSKIDSRTILDQMGAEALLGQGDMLYLTPGSGAPTRVHGAFVSDEEVHRVVEYLKSQGEANYVEGILEGGVLEGDGDGAAPEGGAGSGTEDDAMYDQAVAVVLQHKRASISLVQRHLRIGYNRAARLLEQMERSGLVSGMSTNGNRDILAPRRDE